MHMTSSEIGSLIDLSSQQMFRVERIISARTTPPAQGAPK